MSNFLKQKPLNLEFLLSDFLLTQPLGLNTFVILFITEFLRQNRLNFIEMLFLSEWFNIALLLLAAGFMRELLLIATLSEHMPTLTIVSKVGLSIFIYPILVGLVNIIFRVRKAHKNTSYSLGPNT